MRNTTLLLFFLFVMYGKSFAQSLLQELPFINNYSISFQQSSYDKTGLNIDYITPDDPNYYDLIKSGISANRREYVVSHIMGPAILERFWLITYPPIYVDARFRFYFDGETTPRINKTFNELFVSQNPPFEKPLVQEFNESSGGNYSYMRMPVAESLMITVDTPGLYYQFQARQLPRDTVIESWTPVTNQDNLIQEFLNAGQYPKDNWKQIQKDSLTFLLQVGQKKTIALHGQKAIEALQMNIRDLDYSWSKFYKDNGVFHKGTSRFNMKINGDAEDIVLVKRSNKTYHAITKFTELIEQARLYVDNSNIGIWENSNYRAHRYWQNDTIHIPKNSYAGKSQINLRLQYLKGEPWSEYYYWIVCDGVVTDSVDVGDAESEQAHNYTASNVQNIPYNEINNRYDAPEAIKKHNRQILDSLYIHIYFDGENQPSVSAPIGLFFGTGVNDVADMKAIPTGNINGWYYNYFTMPFWENVRIELENKSHRDLNELTFLWASMTHHYDKKEVGYFKTFYNKDSKAATDSTDYLVAEIEGRGALVGTVIEANQNDNTITCWLEGDEHIYIDNSLTPQFIGTGTEDYFNSTFYFYFDEYSLPQNGMTNSDKFFHRSMYRYHLSDPIYFENNLKFKIEHGDYNNKQGNYSSLVFYYWQEEETILTDSLDIGKLTDETLHNYTAPNSKVALNLYAAYEGEKYFEKISHDGYAIPGMVEWTAQILPQNKGVRLLRTFDYSFKNQKAKVYVDDELVGEWLNPGLNTNASVRDDIFDIPLQYTYGKSFIRIKIVNTSDDSPWTELYYKVYTRADETGTITDISVSVPEKHFRLYPTITKDRIQIQAPDDKDWSWQVFDLTGKMIQQGFSKGVMTSDIDLAQQTSGVFFVRIMQVDGSIQVEKVVLIQ